MFRLFIIILLAVCIAGGVAYSQGWLNPYLIADGNTPTRPTGETSKTEFKFGDLLYAEVPLAKLQMDQARKWREIAVDPCHAVVHDKQEVSSTKEGMFQFCGRELTNEVPGLS